MATTILGYIPDKGLSAKNTPKVYKAQFGDGYQQRLAVGINSLDQRYIATFRNRPKADIDALIASVEALQGVTAFTITVSNTQGDETISVVATDWSKVFEYDDYYSATITLERVYEL